jgi:hypothetical protein
MDSKIENFLLAVRGEDIPQSWNSVGATLIARLILLLAIIISVGALTAIQLYAFNRWGSPGVAVSAIATCLGSIIYVLRTGRV